ncbi:hypothetical protein DICPUDRAFT_146994 [Dictyostelium purpureum]|uniref:t-SNARE coiled-coil homology domain-containing protein n=1 Tax=Dictyostelium purpureum TaxID=5786 RepID=F0Z7D9_DICPU|nr:uncharacterized protein DICPUDRAFT_146994 [Dictyostelium purpureum]EGC40123.1 hypothetical protein DICPUDRAFT_146994 [Dictyostelium purpureum]|eukprot:XP_003283313.1 hypothetical protein DICPUDRAFT_146994 [Dictyostelium purpureum]
MSYQPLKQPLLSEDSNYEYEETLLKERNEQAKQLAQDVYHLKGAMDDLKLLVDEQGEQLQVANGYVEQADMDVEVGIEELEQAYVYKTRSRKKMIIIGIVVAIIITIVVVSALKIFKFK